MDIKILYLKNGCTDGRMDIWMAGQMNREMIDGQISSWILRYAYVVVPTCWMKSAEVISFLGCWWAALWLKL